MARNMDKAFLEKVLKFRIFTGNGTQAFGERDRYDFNKIEHGVKDTIRFRANIVPDVSRAGSHGPVILIKSLLQQVNICLI